MADKYGIYDVNATWFNSFSPSMQSLIKANQWSQSQANAYQAFQTANPLIVSSGLTLWLEAGSGIGLNSDGVHAQSWTSQVPYSPQNRNSNNIGS